MRLSWGFSTMKQSRWQDSNLRPVASKATTLTTELHLDGRGHLSPSTWIILRLKCSLQVHPALRRTYPAPLPCSMMQVAQA